MKHKYVRSRGFRRTFAHTCNCAFPLSPDRARRHRPKNGAREASNLFTRGPRRPLPSLVRMPRVGQIGPPRRRPDSRARDFGFRAWYLLWCDSAFRTSQMLAYNTDYQTATRPQELGLSSEKTVGRLI